MPPSNNWEYSTQDKRELKKESGKMFIGLAKQKEGRIGLNIR